MIIHDIDYTQKENFNSTVSDSVANYIASKIKPGIIVDALCGSGACSIAFAKKGCFVIACDNNIQNTYTAKLNAGQ